jgi:hypothetical protein
MTHAYREMGDMQESTFCALKILTERLVIANSGGNYVPILWFAKKIEKIHTNQLLKKMIRLYSGYSFKKYSILIGSWFKFVF